MQLQLVTLEQAKKLKDLGFDWFTLHYYYNSNFDNYSLACRECEKVLESEIPAPSVALALKWFRDEKKIPNGITIGWHEENICVLYKIEYIIEVGEVKIDFENYETYEECESALLDALIEYAEGRE